MNSVFRDTRAQSEECLCIEVKNDADHITARVSSYEAVAESIANLLDEPDPPDPWNLPERVGRVSTLSHAIASVRAVERAYGYRVPPNADLVRNLMIAAQHIHDHVIHFYHLHALDWADMGAALAADPRKSAELQRSLSGWPNASEAYFARVQQRLVRFFGSGRLGVFGNGYWGHPEYRLPAELDLILFAHYLAVLDWPRQVARLHALLAGTDSPPTFMVGGTRCIIGYAEASNALDGAGLDGVGAIIAELQTFVDQVYLPDTLAIARFYKDWALRGQGVGNFLTYGEFPAPCCGAHDPGDLLIPRGAILDQDLSIVHAVDLDDPYQIQEHFSQARGGQGAAAGVACHPYDMDDDDTLPDHRGRRGTRFRHRNRSPDQGRVPRWRGKPMEVGPLARVLMLYATGHRPMEFLVDNTLDDLELPLPALFSTLGRLIARTLETKLLVDQMAVWYRELLDSLVGGDRRMHNSTLCSPCGWPLSAMGGGYTEAPEGALAHWAVIDEGRIANYQTIVPAAWNAGPCDAQGQEGPYAAALRGQCLHDGAQPLEILRTLHSFGPGAVP